MNATTKKRILIIEDDASLHDILYKKFLSEGFEVFEAKNGEEGLKLALSKYPDIILLDIVMPVMDGMTMLKKLRENAWGINAKVIMLTNLNDIEKIADAIANRSHDYLVKTDWNLEDIIAIVKKKLAI